MTDDVQQERIRSFRSLERIAGELSDLQERTGDRAVEDAWEHALQEKSRLRRTIMDNGGFR